MNTFLLVPGKKRLEKYGRGPNCSNLKTFFVDKNLNRNQKYSEKNENENEDNDWNLFLSG